MPTPSWTVSFTTPTASNSPAKACAATEVNRTRRLDQTSSPVTQSFGQRGAPPGRHHSVTVGGFIHESRAALSRYTWAASSESAVFERWPLLPQGKFQLQPRTGIRYDELNISITDWMFFLDMKNIPEEKMTRLQRKRFLSVLRALMDFEDTQKEK